MKYWIAHNGKDVFHSGVLDDKQVISTGQPYLEQFDTKEDWVKRATELGIEIEKLSLYAPELVAKSEHLPEGATPFEGLPEHIQIGLKELKSGIAIKKRS